MSRRERRRERREQRENAATTVIAPGLEGGQYKPLSPVDVERIHQASLTVLERVGIGVEDPECQAIFAGGGARVDTAKNRVYLSSSMVEAALATAANSVTLYGRNDDRHNLNLGGRRVYMGTGGAAVKVLDLNGRVRESNLADVAQIARLVDALDNIHFYLRPVVARDLSNELLDINTYYAALANTTKHVTGNCFTIESVRQVVEMGSMIAGSVEKLRERPFLSFVTSWTVSPLRYAAETVAVLTEIVRQGLPVFLSSAPQAGATSPAALAGTLVQINAEELSGLVYCNLIRPGAPVILGYVPSVSDLRT
ncbi:MAG: trimethylamine methyltransferase family protein, partial [Chloroflexota bacterium]